MNIMAHLRNRFLADVVRKQARLWPVVGVIGPRQSGKSTLLGSLLGLEPSFSFDDLELREEASRSPKTFLARLNPPVVLDEVQKAPAIFDAIKLAVDKKRVPGSFFLTGSTAFSARIGIRESLTGRIGLAELFPMSLAELHQKEFRPIQSAAHFRAKHEVRFEVAALARCLAAGGMPVPAFLRETSQRDLYWRSWLETTLLRDVARFFRAGYDPDFSYRLIQRMGVILNEGELPTLKHFKEPARKVRSYLSALQDVFLVRKIACHPEGIGKEAWLFMDSGLAAHIMGKSLGEAVTLSLVRHFLWNEWACQREYQGSKLPRVYYKSAQGSPVDALLDGVPFRIVADARAVSRRLSWEERPLLGAMKKLGAKFGYLVAPVDTVIPPGRKGGVGVLPWTAWS